MNQKGKIDWVGFSVQFFFGAIFGAALGLEAWVKSSYAASPSMTPGVFFIGGGALLVGSVAGCFRDDLWRGIGDVRWFKGWFY